MTDVISTTWAKLPGELSKHLEELGEEEKNRQVTMEIVHLKEGDLVTVTESVGMPIRKDREEWLRRFRAFTAGAVSLPHQVDDRRETIYSEAVRDSG